MIKNKWLGSFVSLFLIAFSPSSAHADDQGEKNNKDKAVRRGEFPMNKPLSRWNNHTFYTQMYQSQWEPGDGDKPRILSNQTFEERLERYHSEQPNIINKMREHQIYWQMDVKRPSYDFKFDKVVYSEINLREMSLLISEGSYIQAIGSTVYQDHYRRESWLVTRGILDPINFQDYIRDHPGHFFKHNKIMAGAGIDIVKAYYNAVSYDLEGYKNLGKEKRLLKNKLKIIAREHLREYFKIIDAAEKIHPITVRKKLLEQSPELYVGIASEDLKAVIDYKRDLERVRKMLILNIQTEAKVGELLEEARHWQENPWNHPEIVLPNIDPNTGKSYPINFEPIYPGEDLLHSDFDMKINPPEERFRPVLDKRYQKQLKEEYKRRQKPSSATGSSVTHSSAEETSSRESQES